jgi:hypothetical protein
VENVEKGEEGHEENEEYEKIFADLENENYIGAMEVQERNEDQDEEEQGRQQRQQQRLEDVNISFCSPLLSLLRTPAPELQNVHRFLRRDVISTQSHENEEDQQRQDSLVDPNENHMNRLVLPTTRVFELRSSETLRRLVEERRNILGMRNDPLRCIRRHVTDEPRYGRGRSGGVSDIRMRRRQRTARAYLRYSHDSSSEDGVQDMGDQYDPGMEGETDEDGEEAQVSSITRLTGYLRSLPPDFFTSAEARMETEGSESQAAVQMGQGTIMDLGEYNYSRKRAKKYDAFGLEHEPENCPDLRYVYEQQFEISIQRGRTVEPYRQLKTAVGQLARFAVAVDVVEAEIFAEAGGLFQLTTSSELIRAFIGGFQAMREASTVATKSSLLAVLCRMAKLYFGRSEASPETSQALYRVDETLNLLAGFRRVEKATSRRQTAARRDESARETFIHSSDWYVLQRRIQEDMHAVSAGMHRLAQQFRAELDEYLDSNPSFVRKYSLLLLVYILLSGGGQRPQAYCSFQYPNDRVIKSWDNEESAAVSSDDTHRNEDAVTRVGDADGEREHQEDRSGSVKLYPAHEKTPRGSFHPGVVFPVESRKYFLNYVLSIRPAILHRARRTREDALDPDRPFLVHSETGRALSGTNLRSTLRTYVVAVGGLKADLSNVTVMTLRASYASVMFRAYRHGRFPGQTTEQFLSELAEVMNTSPEMLRTTYIATNGRQFDESARTFLRASQADEERAILANADLT